MLFLLPHILALLLFGMEDIIFRCCNYNTYLMWHVGQSVIGLVMNDRDFIGGLFVWFIKARKRFSGICWLMISRSNLSDGIDARVVHKQQL